MTKVWVRRCASYAEERAADREFWASLTPHQRVAAIDGLRTDWLKLRGLADERLRRAVRVLEPARR
ncbi:MAG: hypothetical protein ACRDH5_10445 [bacterium]